MIKKRVTLDDVAREAGVSAMTVSRVINETGRISEATRIRVRLVIERLDYRPSRAARALVTHKTYMIGVIVPDITNPYFAEIVQGIEDVAWEHNYSVLLANTSETPRREEAVLDQLEDSTIDGVIVCSSRLTDEALFPLLEKQQAVVVVNRRVPKHLASVVRSRFELGDRAKRGAEHLIRTGRQRIGYLRLIRSAALPPLEDFTTFIQSMHIAVNPNWYLDCAPTWKAGYEACKQLLARNPELDGIVGGNDLVALGAMRAALEAGYHIPGDIAVVGGDDILLASQVTPSLTTFRSPKYEIGTSAAHMIFEQLGGDTAYREYLFGEDLIVRDSAP
jgi:LacI family transcriptional regulator